MFGFNGEKILSIKYFDHLSFTFIFRHVKIDVRQNEIKIHISYSVNLRNFQSIDR